MKAKDALGVMGESLACDHLTEIGYTIIDRNWRCEFGEIDIVARQGSTLIVCEVKTRSSLRHGDPVEAVSARKVRPEFVMTRPSSVNLGSMALYMVCAERLPRRSLLFAAD